MMKTIRLITVKKILFYFFITVTLLGCETTRTTPNSVEWQSHQERLKQVKAYQAVGRLGYISPDLRQSLHFHWQKNTHFSQLRLSTFLGQTVLNLSMTPTGTVAQTYDNKTLKADDAEKLIFQLTGLLIPVEQLQDWLLGLPTQADSFKLDENNTLASLNKKINHSEWLLTYQQYSEQTWHNQSIQLPQKMKLQQSDASLTIAISKWIMMP